MSWVLTVSLVTAISARPIIYTSPHGFATEEACIHIGHLTAKAAASEVRKTHGIRVVSSSVECKRAAKK